MDIETAGIARLEGMFRQFESARGNNVETAVAQLASYALEERTDWLTVLTVVDKAYETILRGPDKAGRAVDLLNRVESYLSGNSITFKFLYPENYDEAAMKPTNPVIIGLVDKIQHKVDRISQKGARYYQIQPSRPEYLQEAIQTVQVFAATQSGNIPVPVTGPMERSRGPLKSPREMVTRRYYDILETVSQMVAGQSTPEAMAQARERLFDLLAKAPFNFAGLPDAFDRVWGGVTLRDILEIDAQDIDAYGTSVLQLMGAVPRGDIFWSRVNTLFLVPLFHDDIVTSETAGTEFAIKRFLFQKWLSEKFLLPAFADSPLVDGLLEETDTHFFPDSSFDLLFAQGITNLDRRSAGLMGSMLYTVAERVIMMQELLNPEFSRDDALDTSSILYLAELYREQGSSSHFIIMSRAVNRLLFDHLHIIESNFAERFYHFVPSNRRLKDFFGAFRDRVTSDYDGEHGMTIEEYFQSNLGGNFLERLHQRASEIDEVSNAIWQGLSRIDYWPSSSVVHQIDFDERSLASIMGIESVDIVVGDSKNDSIGVSFRLRGESFGFSAEIDPEGSLHWLFDVEKVNDDILTISHYLAVASVYDMVRYGDIVIRDRHTRKPPEVTGSDESNRQRDERGDHVTKRQLPRQRNRVLFTQGDIGLEGPVSSYDIKNRIEQDAEERGIVVRHVGTTRRMFSRVDIYLDAVRALHFATEDTIDKLVLLAHDARRLIRQPSAGKVREFPEGFGLTPLLNPITDEQLRDIKEEREGELMWLDTWVKQYDVPKLTPAEIASLPTRYRNRYQASSALSFEQEIILWIQGLDAGEDSAEE